MLLPHAASVSFKKGVRVWICDGCGKREQWRKGWHHLPGVVSLANVHEDPSLVLPLAFCSDACEDVALAKAMEASD